MNNDDILALWQQYDGKLDRIEKLNRQIIYRMISRKTSLKLNFIKFQGLYTVVLAPVIFTVVVLPLMKRIPTGPLSITGLLMVILMLLHGMYFGARLFNLGKKIKINTDPLLVTKQKLLNLRGFFLKGYKDGYWSFFLGSAGLILMMWPFLVQIKTIRVVIFYAVFFTFVPLWSRFVKRIYIRKLYDLMELELDELKEYDML